MRKGAGVWRLPSGAGAAARKPRAGKGQKPRRDPDVPEPPGGSPLIYDPRAALQELMRRHRPPPELGAAVEIARYEASVRRYPRVEGRLALSQRLCRFSLPSDLRQLEGLSPRGYLMNYCHVCPRRQAHYKRYFDKFDKDRDGLLSFQEAARALLDLYKDLVTPLQVRQLLGVLQADHATSFSQRLFLPLSALTERLLYRPSENENKVIEDREKDKVEEADFSGLMWKFQGCQISDELKKLIYLL
ncbi:uncharacterized protein LOC129710624 [Leucoraja erinacea]|uniref:uncharacterized protein LOC129710624 n=1 Tax=Leucoraja erinaceus TaxID=7782 RepID=UPI002457FB80|nr:uncharacterized protein LOC129710624 [Leucoraja erinacea]